MSKDDLIERKSTDLAEQEDAPLVVKEQTEEERLKELADSYLDQLKRTQADFENFQKRVEKEKAMLVDLANEKLICDLLETLDNFERALGSLGERSSKDREGVQMLYDGLIKVLADNGLERITAKGRLFDPHIHEAVMQVESKLEEGTVVEEFQTGYAFKGKVVRPARVSVAKTNEDSKEVIK